jgi:hypothetical protein
MKASLTLLIFINNIRYESEYHPHQIVYIYLDWGSSNSALTMYGLAACLLALYQSLDRLLHNMLLSPQSFRLKVSCCFTHLALVRLHSAVKGIVPRWAHFKSRLLCH